MNKEEKKTLCRELIPYVKAGKAMSKHCASFFNWIEQTWNIANQNKVSQLHYSKSSKTFFLFVTTVDIHTPTPSHC